MATSLQNLLTDGIFVGSPVFPVAVFTEVSSTPSPTPGIYTQKPCATAVITVNPTATAAIIANPTASASFSLVSASAVVRANPLAIASILINPTASAAVAECAPIFTGTPTPSPTPTPDPSPSPTPDPSPTPTPDEPEDPAPDGFDYLQRNDGVYVKDFFSGEFVLVVIPQGN